jgi:hypothetical protein
MTGHQYNKDQVQFVPQQQQSHTDNIVGELVGRLMNKKENNENKEVQQYTKEVQPINKNENTSNINIYNNVPGTTESKKSDAIPSQTPDNQGENTSGVISDGIRNATRTATEDFFLNAGAGLASIAGAAFGASGWRNRKAINNSISNIPTNARNRLSSIRESFRSPTDYQPLVDESSRATSVAGSRRPSNASSQAASVARPPSIASSQPASHIATQGSSLTGSRRPSNASIASNSSYASIGSSQNSLLSGSSQEGNIKDTFFTAVGISPERGARAASSSSARRGQAARTRSNSSSSQASVNYREGAGTNLMEQFDNTSAARTPAKKNQVLTQNKENY